MAQGGNVNITIADGGSASIIVPGSSVQLVIGCSSSGTVGQVVATRSPATLQSTFGQGPLPEAAALACLQGGTVLAIRATTQTAGTLSTVTATAAGTSVMTVTGTPVDTYYVKVLILVGGTQASTGMTFQVSLDAGRNYGPAIVLGTAVSYAIPNTGITMNFAAGTFLAGGTYTFASTEPKWNAAGLQAAFNAFQASQYGVIGVGSTHIVGVMNGSDATSVQGYLDTLANGYVYTRAIVNARDASPVAAYGGTGESESTWMSSIQTDYSTVAARRICPAAAYWNIPTAFPNPASTGAPSLRRSIGWLAAARQVTVPPQRHLGRVKDGSLSGVVINATSDPQDGFIYHDERINPGLDYVIAGTGGRFMSTMTRTGLPGVYITNPLTAAPLGSDFFLMPLGSVMDVFASIMHTVGQQTIDDDVRLNANGTIYENDARAIEAILANSVNSIMFSQKMISQPVAAGPTQAATGSAIIVDRTNNVRSTNNVNVSGQIIARGYVLTLTVTLSYQNPNAAV